MKALAMQTSHMLLVALITANKMGGLHCCGEHDMPPAVKTGFAHLVTSYGKNPVLTAPQK